MNHERQDNENLRWWERLRREFLDIRRHEWRIAGGLSLFFFLIISSFWIVKPIKRGLLLSVYSGDPINLAGWELGPAELEQVGKFGNLLVIFFVVAGLTALLRRFRRDRLLIGLALGFAIVFGVFAWFIGDPGPGLAWSLYIFGDVFNTLMVGLFWAFTADILRPNQAKRLYGLVGAGGVIGGFVGATLVVQAVETVGRAPLLLTGAIAMVLIAGITRYVDRVAEGQGAQTGEALGASKSTSAALEGARLALGSRYLLGVVGLIALYELTSNVVDFQLASMVQLEVEGDTEKDAFFGLVGQLTGVLSIAVQLFVTSVVMRRLGVGAALLVLPIAVLGSSTGFLFAPMLAVAAVMSVSDNALNYSINQSAKEALYVPLSRDEKYKAKAFIDMFVQRAAKVLAVALNLGFAAWIGIQDVRWLSVVTLASVVAWIALARHLGRSFDQKADAHEDAE